MESLLFVLYNDIFKFINLNQLLELRLLSKKMRNKIDLGNIHHSFRFYIDINIEEKINIFKNEEYLYKNFSD